MPNKRAAAPVLDFQVDSFIEIDSTNEEAIRRGRTGDDQGLVVIADRQSAGRGRRGRIWQSPVGNLYLSILLRPQLTTERLSELAFVAALGVARTIESIIANAEVKVKWPNDILVEDAKISGVLIESELAADTIDFVVVGIGINIAHLPDSPIYPATSLKAHGAIIDRDATAELFLNCFKVCYLDWQNHGFQSICEQWLQRAWRLGNTIKVDGVIGYFTGIDPDGALLMKSGSTQRRVTSGSVAYESAT